MDANDVTVAWRGGDSTYFIMAARTTDGGQNWTERRLTGPMAVADLPIAGFDSTVGYLPDGVPVVLYGGGTPVFEANGLGTGFYDTMTLARNDGPGTWSYHQVALPTAEGVATPDFMDLAVAPDSGMLYVTAQLLPATAVTDRGLPDEARGILGGSNVGIYLWTSADRGDTWSRPVQILPGSGQGTTFYGARISAGAGGLVALVANSFATATNPDANAPSGHVMLISHDGGSTFAQDALQGAPETFLVEGAPAILHEGTGDRIDVVATDLESGNITLFRSLDQGANWSPVQLGVVGGHGTWAVVSDRPDGLTAALVNHSEGCRSGKGWGVEVFALTPGDQRNQSSLAQGIPPTRGCYGNEYGGLAFAKDSTLWAAWADGRGNEWNRISVAHLRMGP